MPDPIRSIEHLIIAVRADSNSWDAQEPKWFRGEPNVSTALTPTLLRGFTSHENALLQMFHARAGGFHDAVPIREQTDQWLFLARHAGLPTRLLDWSESALIGLYFALKESEPVVWMLNPLDMSPTRIPLKHAHGSFLSHGMTRAAVAKIQRSKTCAELGNKIVTATRYQWRFIQLTCILD